MLAPWKKRYKNLESVLKSRDITLPTKVHIVKAMLFPAVMYRWESWTIKKAERWRIDAFKLWCWRRPLRVLQRANSLEKTLMLEKIEGRRRRGQQRIRYLDSITDSIGMNWRTEAPGVLQSMGSQRAGYDLATEQQQIFLNSLLFTEIHFVFAL